MKTKKLIFAALFAALTCVATMIIKVPTPTMGYIHPGDSIVLLSGFLLDHFMGGLAAGIGSMFSDLFGGYFSYAPATFVIKMLTAVFASLVYRAFYQETFRSFRWQAGSLYRDQWCRWRSLHGIRILCI